MVIVERAGSSQDGGIHHSIGCLGSGTPSVWRLVSSPSTRPLEGDAAVFKHRFVSENGFSKPPIKGILFFEACVLFSCRSSEHTPPSAREHEELLPVITRALAQHVCKSQERILALFSFYPAGCPSSPQAKFK